MHQYRARYRNEYSEAADSDRPAPPRAQSIQHGEIGTLTAAGRRSIAPAFALAAASMLVLFNICLQMNKDADLRSMVEGAMQLLAKSLKPA